MENATKALLIAGSVLIAILLIAMGMRIFNSTKGTADSAQTVMDATSKSIVMNQFTSYVGNNVSTSKVLEFLNKIAVYNATVPEGQQVFINSWSYEGEGSLWEIHTTDSQTIFNEIIPVISGKSNLSWKIVFQGMDTEYKGKKRWLAFEVYYQKK